MQAIRRLLQSAFGFLALIFISASFFAVANFHQILATLTLDFSSGGFQDLAGLRRLAAFALLVLGMLIRCVPIPLSALYVTAWFTLREGKASGRAWALTASIVTALQGILFLAPILRYWSQIQGLLGSGLLVLIGALLLIGVPGTIAFAPRNSARSLALQQPKRVKGDGTSRNMDRFAILLQVAVIVGGGQAGWHWAWSRGGQPIVGPSSSLLLFPEIALIVALHELGHIVAGLCFGMNLNGVMLGPLHLYNLDGKWNLRFERRLAGAVLMIPRTPKRDRMARIWGIAGGPIASLLSGIVFLCWAAVIPVGQSAFLWDFCAWTGILSLSIFVLNVIPVRSQALYSDGAKIFQILTRSVLDDYYWTLSFSRSVAVTPNRPRDYDLDALRRVLDSPVGQPLRVVFRLMESECLFERGLLEQSAESVAKAQAAYDEQSELMTAGSICAFVFGHAILRGDATTARLWSERLEGSYGFSHDDRWLCSAAVACAEGFKGEAQSLLDQFDRFHHERRACGSRDFNLYLSHVIREKFAGRADSSAPVLCSVAAPPELQAQPAYSIS